MTNEELKAAIGSLKTIASGLGDGVDTCLGWLCSLEKVLGGEGLREEFRHWLTDVYKKGNGNPLSKTAVGSYVNSLFYLTDTKAFPGQYDQNSTSYWYNMYHYLYGVDGISVYAYDAKESLLKAFAGVYMAITEGDAPEGVDVKHFNEVRRWSQKEAVKNSSWILFAFKRYFDFLEWRKAKSVNQELGRTDSLQAALLLFQRERGLKSASSTENGANEGGPDGWASYDAWAEAVRAEFARVDAGMFSAEGFDYAGFMRKFVYSVTVANTLFANHTADERDAVGNFISQERVTPHAVSWYLDPGNRPTANGESVPGMGTGVMLNFMMKVRPAEFATYSKMIDEMLVFTGLAKTVFPKDPTVESYEASKALQGQVLAKMHELKIGQTAESATPADYLTVNEFAWWLSDEKNRNLIKEKIMSETAKKPSDECAADGDKSIAATLKQEPDSMMARLTAALLTKPFAILAGASGTGKSRMVKKLAYMTCRADMLRSDKEETPGNYCMIAVKPNWHDSSELLGYRSAFGSREYVTTDFLKFILKAHAFPETPFFVCLDEMNLAPVEQYFAEYLSAVESVGLNKDGEWTGDPLVQKGDFDGEVANLAPEYQLDEKVAKAINEKGLFIPRNLFVVGTVNMDDTTNQFSRKVLDRAMTIMMNKVDFATLKGAAYEKLTNDLRIKNDEIEKFVKRTSFDGSLLEGGNFEVMLDGLRKALEGSPFEIGYRYAIETAVYREALKFVTGKTGKDDDEKKDLSQTAIDHTALMKVLPRITGTLTEREEVLKRLGNFFTALAPHKLSADMLESMKKAAENNGNYISFWP